MPESECSYAIEMLGITKAFSNIIANDNITFRVKEGEIHALLGENGAGKSTLMSVLFGAYLPDAGDILVRGKKASIKSPNAATELGIGMVHQHFKLVHNYTVTENIVLGMEPTNRFGMLNLSSAKKRVKELSQAYGLAVDVDAYAGDITVGQQQRVEILKTLYRNADIIIFDEPTAVLTPQEIDELIAILKRLKEEGKTIILITHKLKEIKAAADRCTVLRRGRLIGTIDVETATEMQLAEMMVGRAVEFEIKRGQAKPTKNALSIKGLSVKDELGNLRVKDFSLDVRAGEIVGIAGVDGNGQRELLYALAGLLPIESGNILINGQDVSDLSIRKRIELGLGYVPEDRQRHGIVLEFSIAENLALKNYYKAPYKDALSILNFSAMKENASKLIDEFDIRAAEGAETSSGSLSGGNQQKLIIAREISLSPEILVIAQPTRGLDVGAIEYIRKRIVAERDKGCAVLLVSFELDEIINLCDRIAAISSGSLVSVFESGEATEREIGLMMAGSKN